MTTETRGQARIAAYHEQRQDEPDWRHIERIARDHKEDAFLERVLAMPAAEREATVARLGTSFRLTLGGYEERRSAHQQWEARQR